MYLIDRIPLAVFVVAAVLLALAPFFPEPHLWEKLVMLANGELTRPVDVFDLFVHGGPLVLLGVKLKREFGSFATEVPDDSVDN